MKPRLYIDTVVGGRRIVYQSKAVIGKVYLLTTTAPVEISIKIYK